MQLPAGGEGDGVAAMGWGLDVETECTDCSCGQQRRELALRVRLHNDAHEALVVLGRRRHRRERARNIALVLQL